MVEDSVLIAVSVESISKQPYISPQGQLLKSALIKAKSHRRELNFELQTGLLNPEQEQRCERLMRHGFTTVELPADARLWDNGPGGWKDQIIMSAMERINSMPNDEGIDEHGYDTHLAEKILEALHSAFPVSKDMTWLKRQLNPEPSDSKLFRAIDALEKRGLVSGAIIRTGINQVIRDIYNLEITKAGFQQVDGVAGNPTTIHGDQIINFGHAGAIGRHSVGTMNHQQQWASVETQVDFSKLIAELEQLKAELKRTAETPADFRQLELVAEAKQYAEKHDGMKVIEVFSKMGKGVFDFAKDIGTEITAKLLAKALGLEP